MSAERALKVAQTIKKELAEMIQRDLKDERLKGLISITDVECTSDLRSTKVHISVFGDNTNAEKVVEALNEHAGYMRGEVCRRLKLRFAPEMHFRLDESLERGSKVTELLGKISRGEV
jgi:ribosome-binding factor A